MKEKEANLLPQRWSPQDDRTVHKTAAGKKPLVVEAPPYPAQAGTAILCLPPPGE